MPEHEATSPTDGQKSKMYKVTFAHGLPLGEHAYFQVDKERWIAYPAKKISLVFAIMDRLIGIHNAITKDMIGWINERPQDTELISRVLDRTNKARELTKQIIIDKVEAKVS